MKLRNLLPVLFSALSFSSMASTHFDSLATLSRNNFVLLAKDFTAAASYKAVAPGEPLGLTGFDLGVELTATRLESETVWKQAGADVSTLPIPKLHLIKGLPADFNVGFFYASVPNSSIQLIGGELSYAFFSGGVIAPAVAARAAYTQLSGVDQLDLNTKSIEFTASKGFLNLMPYVGVGQVWGDVTAKVGGLGSVSVDATKLFAGLNMNLGLMNFAVEADRTGSAASVSAKVGVRF